MIEPWRRNMIAMAHGIILKPSGKMKWIANVTVFSVTPKAGQMFSVFPLEADCAIDAARSAASLAAQRVYGQMGSAGFVNQTEAPYIFMATIGLSDMRGVVKGQSAEIMIREYRGLE